MKILVFMLGGERYAIPLAEARRILHAVAVTRLPGAPEVIEGVVSVHGVLTPVFDLRRRFGLPARGVAPEDHFILTAAAGRPALLHVERAEEVTEADPSDVGDPPDVVVGTVPISGVAKLEQGLVLIHDLEAFLTQAESAALDAALEAAVRENGGTAESEA